LIHFKAKLKDYLLYYSTNSRIQSLLKNIPQSRSDLLTSEQHSVGPTCPMFTVVVPVYQTPKGMLFKCLQSVQKQKFKNFEIALYLDGPQPEHVEAEITEALKKPCKIRVHREFQDKARGISHALNALINSASGEYVFLLDHDDFIHPYTLELYAEKILRNKQNSALYFCDEYKITTDDRVIGGSFFEKSGVEKQKFFASNLVCHALCFKKDDFLKWGAFRSEFDSVQDFEFCLRALRNGAKLCRVPYPLYAWRSHQNSTAKSLSAKNDVLELTKKAVAEDLCERSGNTEVSLNSDLSQIFVLGLCPIPLSQFFFPHKHALRIDQLLPISLSELLAGGGKHLHIPNEAKYILALEPFSSFSLTDLKLSLQLLDLKLVRAFLLRSLKFWRPSGEFLARHYSPLKSQNQASGILVSRQNWSFLNESKDGALALPIV